MSSSDNSLTPSPRLAPWLNWPVASGFGLVGLVIAWNLVGAVFNGLGSIGLAVIPLLLSVLLFVIGASLFTAFENPLVKYSGAGLALIGVIWAVATLLSIGWSAILVALSLWVIFVVGAWLFKCYKGVMANEKLGLKAGPSKEDLLESALLPVALARSLRDRRAAA